MDIHDKELHSLAKKHKKIFEKYSINVGAYLINENEFHWVNFYKFGKMVGHAVISPNNVTDMNEYKEAFYYLSKSSQLRANLSSNGGFRAAINMDSFITVKKFLESILQHVDLKEDKHAVINCLESVQSNLNQQDRIVEIYNSFHQKEEKIQNGEVKFCTEEYLDFTLACLSEIEYLQFNQFNLQYDAIPLFEYIINLSKQNRDVKKFMSTEVSLYLKEFIRSKKSLLNSIKNLTFTSEIEKGLSKKRHMTLAKETLLKSINDVTKEALEDLRFPKF